MAVRPGLRAVVLEWHNTVDPSWNERRVYRVVAARVSLGGRTADVRLMDDRRKLVRRRTIHTRSKHAPRLAADAQLAGRRFLRLPHGAADGRGGSRLDRGCAIASACAIARMDASAPDGGEQISCSITVDVVERRAFARKLKFDGVTRLARW